MHIRRCLALHPYPKVLELIWTFALVQGAVVQGRGRTDFKCTHNARGASPLSNVRFGDFHRKITGLKPLRSALCTCRAGLNWSYKSLSGLLRVLQNTIGKDAQ